MAAAGVRTANSEIVDNPAHLDAALDRFGPDAGEAWVVKDDGLAAGKGVVVTADRDAARAHAAACSTRVTRCCSSRFSTGPRCRCSAWWTAKPWCRCCPRRTSNGSATTTPGRTPAAWAPMRRCHGCRRRTAQIVDDIVKPVAAELVRRGSPFSGLLYAGLAITSKGPAVVEFNCRFGDPETQSVLALLDSPLGELLHAAATGSLAEQPPLRWRDGAAVTVVLAAENYPGRPRVGDVIVGAEADGVLHAGTARRDDGAILSCGGRVLSVVGTGADLPRPATPPMR